MHLSARTSRLVVCSFSLLFLAACSDNNPVFDAESDSASFADSFQTLLIQAQPGDIIDVPAGVHEFTRSLSLTVPGVTIRGAGMDTSILSFKNQVQGAEGLLVSADDFTIEHLAIEDTVGDALKINQSTNVVVRGVRTEWTNGPDSSNGAYGIYPVQSANILIEDSVAIGAADAGIYVGQSTRIIVRSSRAEFNVAGIEIENSTFADVFDNVATNNTGGILVFDLPNLPVQGGQATRVFNNRIFNNNTENFAPPGNIVGNVPPGTGMLILANDNIEVFDNEFADNGNVNLMIYSFVLGGRTVDDPDYDPYPEQIHVRDNRFLSGGDNPRHWALVELNTITGEPSPNIVWDGLVKPGEDTIGTVCIGNNDSSHAKPFVNLNAGSGRVQPVFGDAVHDCSLPELSPVIF